MKLMEFLGLSCVDTFSEVIFPLHLLTLVWNGGPPPTDVAGLPRLWTPAGQGNRLHVLVEPGWFGQPDHGQTVEGGAVGTVKDCEVRVDVLLRALLHSDVMVPQGCSDVGGSARTA